MKPAPFHYEAPRELAEATTLLSEHGEGGVILAGGQSLMPLLNLRLARPDVVIDINRVSGLDDIASTEAGTRLGALVRAERLVHDRSVASHHPLLSAAVAHIGHPQIRNRTTVGGNIAHADPASELPAVLAVTNGWVTLASAEQTRRVGWEEFFEGPYRTSRNSDELVTAVDFPCPTGMMFTFAETVRRPGDYALAGVCVGLRVIGGRVSDARIALFGVGATVIRAREVEARLRGEVVDDAGLMMVREAVAGALTPNDDLHAPAIYRRHLAGNLASRAVADLWRSVRE